MDDDRPLPAIVAEVARNIHRKHLASLEVRRHAEASLRNTEEQQRREPVAEALPEKAPQPTMKETEP